MQNITAKPFISPHMTYKMHLDLSLISSSNDLDCREVYVDVLDDAGDQDGVLDLGEALGEVLDVSENNVHENDLH